MRKLLLLPFAALLFAAPASAADAPYITRDQIDITHVLPPPPQPGTIEEQHDVAAVLDMQAHASDADSARAVADGDETIERIAEPVLGAKFRAVRLPKTEAFFQRVRDSYAAVLSGEKTYFHHDRPFVLDPNVRAPEAMVKDICNPSPGPGSPPTAQCPNGVSYSYPSGHSTFGTVVTLILAEMIPEKRDALLLRGRQFGESRVINGVHFPTDIEAGRIQGSIMVALMMQNPQFRADLAEAKAELRAVLGLSVP